MDVTTLVRSEFIRTDVEAHNADAALRYMAGTLLDASFVKPTFEQAIIDRERRNPSGLPMDGPKIAIPHTSAEHVEKSVLFFVRLAQPVEFRAMGDPDISFPVQLISMFALKEAKKIGALLEALITVYKDRDARSTLVELPDAAAIYSFLVDRLRRGRL